MEGLFANDLEIRWGAARAAFDAGQAQAALQWFLAHEGQGYDYLNIGRFVLPFVGQDRDRWVCFESLGAAFGMAGAHKLTANDLRAWVDQLDELQGLVAQ